MRVIIAGSRGVSDLDFIEDAVSLSGFIVSRLISGGARGIDQTAERWAKERLQDAPIPVSRFLPQWSTFGRSAGFRRNVLMADHAEALIAIWDGQSKGTEHMIEAMKDRGKPVYVYRVVAWQCTECTHAFYEKDDGTVPEMCPRCGQ